MTARGKVVAATKGIGVGDLEIYRTAKLLIDQHGDEAPIHAAMPTDTVASMYSTHLPAKWANLFWSQCSCRNGNLKYPSSKSLSHIRS